MFYEIYGCLDLKRKLVMPKYTIKKEKQEKHQYLIDHFRDYVSVPHHSIVSFLNVILELENHPDYDTFLKILLKLSQKVIRDSKVTSQCTLILDFNHLMKTFTKEKQKYLDKSCKVITISQDGEN